MNINIRNEIFGDESAIEAVTRAAFLTAAYSSHTEHLIVAELRKAGQLFVSLVAEVEGSVVGHVAVSQVIISDGASDWYSLGPLSVVPAYQSKGIGSLLVQTAIAELKKQAACGCVLLGEPEYYRRFGFVADSHLVLADVPPEYFLALRLGTSSARGEVSYHSAFSAQM